MKTFKLKKVVYQNIMSVGSTPIAIQLDATHKTLITGTNGAGKSTMLEAITFALFGKSFRDIKKGQLVNSHINKNMLVELWLEYNNSEYYIKRGQKPNVFEVFKDGDKLDETASNFQSAFEEMIGINYNSYKQIVVLGTAGYTPFMGLSTPNRRKLVEDLLEVSILAEMDKANKEQIKQLNIEIQKNDTELTHIRTNIQTHLDYDERQKKLSGDNLSRLESMYTECVDKVKDIKTKNLELNQKILDYVIPEDVNSDISKNQSSYMLVSNQINTKLRTVTLYNNGGNCPTCLQVLKNVELIDSINSDVSALEKDKAIIESTQKELQIKKDAWESAKTYVNSIEIEISTNRSVAISEVEKAKRLQGLIDEAKLEVVDNSDKIKELNDNMNSIIEKKSSLVAEKHRRTLLIEMLKDSGIKSLVVKKYIPLFNKQINHYLSIMEADYSFTIDEEFSEKITSRGRESFSYASFSQGEKARIDLALLFTWRDIAERVSGIKINCLFLDEVADGSTDAQGVKTIQQILDQDKDSNVFIISHRDHNPQDYGQHLQMRKVGRFTIME